MTEFLPRAVEIHPARESFVLYPMHFDGWRGTRESLDGMYLDTLKLDDYVMANYQNDRNSPVNLYIAYYDSQRKGEAGAFTAIMLAGRGDGNYASSASVFSAQSMSTAIRCA